MDARTLARRAFLLDVEPNTIPFADSPLRPPTRLIHVGDGGDCPHIGDAVCTIGAFDGVHRGHRFLFASMIADARRRGLPSVIMTFDPDPDELFLPVERQHKLLNNEDRLEFLKNFGADFVACVPFTRSLASHSAESFLRHVTNSAFRPRAIHVGSDFKLGAGNAGNVAELRAIGSRRESPCDVFGYDLVCKADAPVSATRIRRLLMEDGDCAAANELLCRAHFVRGTVVVGRRKGREFGFPTANVRLSYPYVVPAEGVYGCLVLTDDGMVWPSAVNVGLPRTFADEPGAASIEANLLGFSGDLYGREISVAFIERLRGQRSFDELDELIATVNSNIAWVRDNLGPGGFEL